jgi:hypothetical protein
VTLRTDTVILACKVAGLANLHKQLENAFAPFLVEQPTIGTQGSGWEKQSWAGTVAFSVSSPGGARVDLPSRIGPAVEMSGFTDGDDKAWMSWREEWKKEARSDNYEILDASFTFYWGSYRPEEILFRAEWSIDKNKLGRAAHPHWHFDLELPSTNLTMTAIHFGMAGWETRDGLVCPECWQRFPSTPQEFIKWASSTLEYIRMQLIIYPPTNTGAASAP